MIWLLLFLLIPADGHAQTVLGNLNVCADTLDLSALYDRTLRPRNQYTLTYLGDVEIQAYSQMILRFDSEVSLKLVEPRAARILKLADTTGADGSSQSNQFLVTFTSRAAFLRIQVFGPPSGYSIPYILSVTLNDKELCKEPKTGYLFFATDKPPVERTSKISVTAENAAVVKYTKEIGPGLDKSCGRRKVLHTALIVHGNPTLPGDWPWHAAILKFDGYSLKFTCGGTLLSKTLVLTAAHCATLQSSAISPQTLIIVLGKYNLIGGDTASQERRVFEVILHPGYDSNTLNNDIALLRLRSEAALNDYVQPACLWHPTLPTEDVSGTVVGWGFNHQNLLSLTLQQITIPIVSELTCLKSDPTFFKKHLNINKFCAGFANGSSVCNGDSGGGLMIFIPDTTGDSGNGAWYVRGIVSFAARRGNEPICDPYQYTIFTDVDKYRDWVLNYLN